MSTAPTLPMPISSSPRTSPKVDQLSDSIIVARVLCILGVVYVHAWTGVDSAALLALKGSGADMARWILMEGFGRSAVPLLGLISGWLVAGSSRTSHWGSHVWHKARTILTPMIAWNIIAVVIVTGAATFGSLRAPTSSSLGWLVEEILILTRNPDINVQMPFLRDLFLCMIAAPFLIRLPSWALGGVFGAAVLCTIAGWGPPVLMRTSILAFFTLGMIVRRFALDRRVAAIPLLVALLPFLLLTPIKLMMSFHGNAGFWTQGYGMAALDLVTRFAAALAFWRVAWAVAETRSIALFRKIEPYMFFMFCAHLIFIWTLAPIIGLVTGPLGSPGYPAFLILQPFIFLGASIVVAEGLLVFFPAAAGMLSGGRIKKRPLGGAFINLRSTDSAPVPA